MESWDEHNALYIMSLCIVYICLHSVIFCPQRRSVQDPFLDAGCSLLEISLRLFPCSKFSHVRLAA